MRRLYHDRDEYLDLRFEYSKREYHQDPDDEVPCDECGQLPCVCAGGAEEEDLSELHRNATTVRPHCDAAG